MKKLADATSVPFADSAMDKAVSSPVPELSVGNKPAPGQTGPKGLAPRTNYSRVNTGSPSPADLGASFQKSTTPDSQGFLPPKVAHREVPMTGTTSPRLTIQQMIKAAGAGAQEHAAVSLEAARQLANHGEAPAPVKIAAAPTPELESIPTSYVEKFASAIEFVLENMKLAEELGPGAGPNALHVTQATSSNNEFASGHQGQATPAHVPPKNPGLHRPAETPHGPANALEDNASMKHGKQPVKLSSADLAQLRKVAAFPTGEGSKKDEQEREPPKAQRAEAKETGADKGDGRKEAGVDPRLVEGLRAVIKQAEDAINPAQISAGKAVPPDTSAAGESGGAPAGGQPQGPTGLVSSTEAAINFKRREAKAHVKPELGKLLTEPALSAAHDTTLNQAFDNTERAGVKISSATPLSTSARALGARALLEKLAEEACAPDAAKKRKTSTGGFTAPPVGGVAGAGM